jgi:hypothetical protein
MTASHRRQTQVLRILLIVPLGILVPMFAVALVSPGLFRRLLDGDGAPQEHRAAAFYRVRPVVHVALGISALIGVAILWNGCREFGLGNWSYVVALGLITLYVFLILRRPDRIVLDGQGMHCYDLIGRNFTILWSDLSHVEIQRQPLNDLSMDSVSYFRNCSGRTITVSEKTFDNTAILDRVREWRPCPEKPYKRQHWYGG